MSLVRAAAALAAALLLAGCAALGGAPAAGDAAQGATAPPTVPAAAQALGVEIEAPAELKALLERHLDLVRLGRLARDEVADSEWSRLIDATPSQARDLLQTEGYFAPRVTLTRESGGGGSPGEVVRLQVDSGPQAQIERVTIEVEGELERGATAGDPLARSVQEQLQRGWALPVGKAFRNPAWNGAKAAALARLRAAGYATASWGGTKADVDAETNKVRLFLVADSGPLFRYGELEVEGLVTQDVDTVRNLVAAPRGAPVTEALVLDFQDRLQKSGLFEGVSVVLDPDPANAAHAHITARMREAPLQAWTFGLGVSANTGPRASVEHIYRRVFGYAALARNKVEYGKLRKVWDGEISSHTGDSLYRNLIGGAVEQLQSKTDIVLSQRIRAGRTQDGQRIERLIYVEAERSLRKTLDQQVRTNAIALSLNYHGVWRDLDSVVLPTQGFSLNGQVGGGHSHGTDAISGPFARLYARFTGYLPVGSSWYSQGRIEFGQVFLGPKHVVPESQQFRAGGDDSVRGYSYRSLGPLVDGAVGSGNVMYTLSAEVARPISAKMPSLWGALFVDAGNAGNKFAELHPAVGLGMGLRWRSPVGPLRLDWAYGRATRKSRIHFSVGIAF